MLARSELPLVLQGETGTGKELFARAIHAASGRPGRLVAVNCSVYQRENASAELFGYRRGAFTGAERNHDGHIQSADTGTLFLNEVSELAANVRPDLLRVLQEGELMRLGESRPIGVSVRVIAATQRPLAVHVGLGRFRADLQARLEGAVIALPPLRQRREEVVPLFLHLVARELGAPIEGMDVRLLEHLAGHAWPLNARELVLLAKKLVVLHRACLLNDRGGCCEQKTLAKPCSEPALALREPPELPRSIEDACRAGSRARSYASIAARVRVRCCPDRLRRRLHL